MALNLYTGNRMEALAQALGDTIEKSPLSSPFKSEVIVVQSRGMQRWLSMQLASRFGVWANAEYPFPNALVRTLFTTLGLEHADSEGFSKEVMRWKIMRLLPDLARNAVFRPLHTYLALDPDGVKLFQLAGKIADTFDQYTLYRPEMLAEWEKGGGAKGGGDNAWQPELWRTIISETSARHRGMLKADFCQRMMHSPLPTDLFPERLTLFALSYLPPFHLEILSAVSRATDLNLFILSPSQHYWGDIVSAKDRIKRPAALRELLFEGNPLLASLGRSGRDFSELVVDLADIAATHLELYLDPGEETLLHTLQSEILNLAESVGESHRTPLSASDRSVQIHSCHTPLREVEVLHDNILDLLATTAGLTPKDILVMAPDIETYAPFISTVFGSKGEGQPFLPHSVADRRLVNEGEIGSAVLKLLEIYRSRLTAPQLFDLISSPPVSRRFGLDDLELLRVRSWIEHTRIRWGMDDRDRKKLHLPDYRENSWRAGLDRLLLGYAMADEGLLYHGILPYDPIQGDSAVTLGKFATFIDSVDHFASSLAEAKSPEEWRTFFFGMLASFITAEESSERELAAINASIDSLASTCREAGFKESLSAPVMIQWLKMQLEEAEQGLGFMTGGITFCSMLPMRSIPFRVVAMIGMNDGDFPRQQHPLGFDLISSEPRRGDRSVRDEDRYLFLESILSARDVFYISYVGRSIRDNAQLPPSVLVSELLDALQRGRKATEIPDDEDPFKQLIVNHRLQGFHPDYFTPGSGLFSYSAENYQAHRGRTSGDERRPFLDAPLQQPDDELKTVTIEKLCRFYANPAAYFLETRLGMALNSAPKPLDEREPFELNGLDAYMMRQELLEAELGGAEAMDLLPRFQSRGLLPPALHGERLFQSLVTDVKSFASDLKKREGKALAPLDTTLETGGFLLTGKLDRITESGQLFYRCASMKEIDRIRSWISHLALNASNTEGYPKESFLVMRDKTVRYSAVIDARLHLETLLSLYWRGLSEPLPFFPKASTAWSLALGKSDEERLKAAAKAWAEGYGDIEGEGSDPAFSRCFGSEPPFGMEFRAIADTLLLPMLDHGGAS
ncbi:MAG: exodeoxyribonuclease V subunit gamma [Chlorobiaceae bacterium]